MIKIISFMAVLVLCSCQNGNTTQNSQANNLDAKDTSPAFVVAKSKTSLKSSDDENAFLNKLPHLTYAEPGLYLTSFRADFFTDNSCSEYSKSSTVPLSKLITGNIGDDLYVSAYSICQNYDGGCTGLYNDSSAQSVKPIKSLHIVYNFTSGNSLTGQCYHNYNTNEATFADFSDQNSPKPCSSFQNCTLSKEYISGAAISPTVQLVVTGQKNTSPFSAVSYSDGSLQKGANIQSRFTRSGDCMIDNLTGLEWPQNWGSYSQQPTTWTTAQDNATKSTLCGFNDWHLPSQNELASLINYGVSDETTWLNSQGFNNTFGMAVWTSEKYAPDNTKAWVTGIVNSGNLYSNINSSQTTFGGSIYGIMVRNIAWGSYPGQLAKTSSDDNSNNISHGTAWPKSRYISDTNNGNCSTTDALTGLTWLKDLGSISYGTNPVTWAEAIDSINAANSGAGYCGYHDWRLPNITELRSMVNYGSTSASWLNANGFLNVAPTFFWSSTTAPWDNNAAYFLSFADGYFWVGTKSETKSLVWPVRGGISSMAPLTHPTQQKSCQINKNVDGSSPLPGGDWQSVGLVAHYSGDHYFCDNISYDGQTLKANCPKYEQHEMGQFVDRWEPVEIKISSCGSCTFTISYDQDNDNLICSEPS